MRSQDLLADVILNNKDLMARYLKGFSDATSLAQAPGLPNHVAWNLGHLALTMHRVCERFDAAALPTADFILPGTPSGDAKRFAADSVAFGSKPPDATVVFPNFARCVEIFNSACDRLAASVRAATDEQLRRQVPWGGPGMQTPLCLLVARMAFHNGFHCGQIADLRRATGMGSIFA